MYDKGPGKGALVIGENLTDLKANVDAAFDSCDTVEQVVVVKATKRQRPGLCKLVEDWVLPVKVDVGGGRVGGEGAEQDEELLAAAGLASYTGRRISSGTFT